jgi:tetratricopeptide (TPR) repeat protein
MENKKGIELIKAACEVVLKEDRTGEMMRRAIVAAEENEIDSAVKFLKRVTEANPTHLDPATILGVLLMTEKAQQGPAMGYFAKAIAQDPNNALAMWYLACDKLRSGRPTEAVALLKAASECEPVDSFAVLTLAWVLGILGKLNEAKSVVHSRLHTGQNKLICLTLELLLESQEIGLTSELLACLFGKLASCLIDLGCVAHSRDYNNRLLSAILKNPDSTLDDNLKQNSGCVHLTNPALDVYKHRYGNRVARSYTRCFL